MATTSHDVLIRPAREEDLAAMAEITADSYLGVDVATSPRTWPEPVRRAPSRQAGWIARTRHTLHTDPEGCWVAEVHGALAGCAISRTRELMWILSSFAVLPPHQGLGIGAQLLQAAQHHGRGCLRAMVASSADPRAVRRYRRAGFALYPQMLLRGFVDRAAIPVIEHVREGSASDVDLLDSIDRRVRGAAHGSDHGVMAAQYRLVVIDHASGSGYAYADEDGAPVLLAATDRRTATALMWECLAASPPDVLLGVRHITAANQWALDVGLDARLDVHQSGYLCLRGMKPPSPYLHHGSLL